MDVARHWIGIALLWASSAGCQLRTFDRAGDAGVDAEIIPDASVCVDLRKECVASTVLRDCQEIDQLPQDIPCPWGCLGDSPAAACGVLQPAADVLTAADLAPEPALMERSASNADGQINSDTGEITGLRAAGPGIVSGIGFEVRTVSGRNVGVFRFGKLELMGRWRVTGQNAIAIASLGEVVIQGRLELSGSCAGNSAGPGGIAGGNAGQSAADPGGGDGGSSGGLEDEGGGGGGHGADGGDGGFNGGGGGNRPRGGDDFGNATISELRGGGGGGGGENGGVGGGGGGAIHLAANGKVSLRFDTLVQPSGINAGGCGGKGGANGGGGGGAGGTILIEAPEVELDGGHLAVNGGGGGGGNNAAGNGENGKLELARANGGTPVGPGAAGGQGGAAGNREGAPGGNALDGGGGGGAVGRIRINTRLMNGVTVMGNAIVSPTFEEASTTSTRGVATVQ